MLLFESGSHKYNHHPHLDVPTQTGLDEAILAGDKNAPAETASSVFVPLSETAEVVGTPYIDRTATVDNLATTSLISLPNYNRGRPQMFTKKGVELPYIESDIFEGHEHAKQMVGMFAIEGNVAPGMAYANQAARQLRYRVYNNLGWVDSDKRDLDGGESDEHDAHSVQFGTIANTPYGPILHGGIRLILSDGKTPLPVEEKYQRPMEDGATELSRLIFQHPNKTLRSMSMSASFRAAIGTGVGLDYKVAYGMVEQYLPRILSARKLAHSVLTDFQPTPEYGNTENALLYVDPHKVLEGTKLRTGASLMTSLFFRNTLKGNGLGYYRDNFFLFREGEQSGAAKLIERYRRNNKPSPDTQQPHWPEAA